MFEKNEKLLVNDAGPFIYEKQNVALTIRQLAVNEPITGGNKWFKLKYNMQKARQSGAKTLVTFGGAFSNHIAATARAGKISEFQTIGIIRGESESGSNITLRRASSDGMKLIFVSREEYRNKNHHDFLQSVIRNEENYFVIPEGGANAEGVKGCMEILGEDDTKFDYISVCCGTGTTAAGIVMSMEAHQHFIGFSVLKDNGFMEKSIQHQLNEFEHNSPLPLWEVNHDFHFGGYAKKNEELISFCNSFKIKTGVAVEPVYTGKMFYALEKLIAGGYFNSGSKILAIHTGGMQYLESEI